MRTRKGVYAVAFAISICLITASGTLLPSVKAQDLIFLQLSPTRGLAGTRVDAYGTGFAGGTITISFGDTKLTSANPEMFGRMDATFIVPDVAPGYYFVIAELTTGQSAKATFTVLNDDLSEPPVPSGMFGGGNGAGAQSPSGTENVTPEVTLSNPSPQPSHNEGFWTATNTVIIAVVVAVIVAFSVFFISRRGNKSAKI